MGGCQLDGDATFAKPLSTASVDTTYSFSGTLSGCLGTFPDTGGTVSAGQPIAIGGLTYQPVDTPTLSGGCSNSDTSGAAFVDWGGGRYSVIDYSTTGAAALVALTGSFRSGIGSAGIQGFIGHGNYQ